MLKAFVMLKGGSIGSAAGIQDSMTPDPMRAGINIAKTLAIAMGLIASPCIATAQHISPEDTSPRPAPLSVEQVVTNLEQQNAQRAAALEQFEGKRIYRMEYRGFPGDKDAQMVVKVSFHAPNSKEFTVVSQTGSKFVIEHVFKKLLESEQEAASGENRYDIAVTRHIVLSPAEDTGNFARTEGDLPVDLKERLFPGAIRVAAIVHGEIK